MTTFWAIASIGFVAYIVEMALAQSGKNEHARLTNMAAFIAATLALMGLIGSFLSTVASTFGGF